MEHDGAYRPTPTERTTPISSLKNGHTPPQSSDIAADTLIHKRLPQLRALLATAKALLIRSPAPNQIPPLPAAPDHLNGYHHQIPPIDPPNCEIEPPQQRQEPHASPRRTKPLKPLQELHPHSYPTPADELLALKGAPEDIAIALGIRERFWTHVVRSLAAESSTGATPGEIQLTRSYYMRSANKKLEARWWISNQDKLN